MSRYWAAGLVNELSSISVLCFTSVTVAVIVCTELAGLGHVGNLDAIDLAEIRELDDLIDGTSQLRDVDRDDRLHQHEALGVDERANAGSGLRGQLNDIGVGCAHFFAARSVAVAPLSL